MMEILWISVIMSKTCLYYSKSTFGNDFHSYYCMTQVHLEGTL